MTQSISRVNLPAVGEIGLVVRDVDKTIEFYGSCGLGPWRIKEMDFKGCVYNGKPCDCRLKLAFLDGPPVSIELVQVVEGETPFSEFLREKGEGVQHLGFFTNDLKGILAGFAKKGIEPVFSGGVPNVADFAFVSAVQNKAEGLMFELVQIYHHADGHH